ncbi:fluoride efflux transporter FluC [Brevibacterium renqingii]|uniref:fluoride efflux transporter FluC n=1 Tax=Brevibacterium renqingii TaxID=2776916 RepID=UPI0020A51D67|nr:CrcB family protein [Brevibacterium renqingii]
MIACAAAVGLAVPNLGFPFTVLDNSPYLSRHRHARKVGENMHRPTHLRASFLGLAFVGGIGGTAAREAISLAVPAVNGIPVAIFAINVLGAFLLGLLLEALARSGPDEGVRRTMRILIGTGFMGGFTTYSALAADAAQLLGRGAAAAGIGYGLATVVLGGLTTWAGIAVGAATHRRPGAQQVPVDPDLAEAAPESRNGGQR